MPSTSGMKADGFYDKHSSGQRASIEALLEWIDAAALGLSLPAGGRPITIADYGCSEGRNSVLMMRRAIDALRARGAKHSICPVFCDLATNNFNQLFSNLDSTGWLGRRDDGVFPAAIGGSFYCPLLPPGAVHLGLSFNAVVWLEKLPAAPLPEFLVYLGPGQHRTDVRIPTATAEAFTRHAAGDLLTFLSCRAAEIPAGGRLLVAQPGRDERHSTGAGLYDLLHAAAIDLVRAGRLDRQAYERVTMPIYFRALDELVAPIDAAAGPLRDRFLIERAETQEVAVPFALEFEHTGDVAAYCQAYVGFAQAFTEPILRAGLDKTHGPEIVPAIYKRAKERLRAEPDKYRIRYIQTAVLLARR